MGRLLSSLRQTLEAKANDPLEKVEKTRLAVYSCHDTSIAGILNALDAFDNRWPPFTSHVAVGAWRVAILTTFVANLSLSQNSSAPPRRPPSSPPSFPPSSALLSLTTSASASMPATSDYQPALPKASTSSAQMARSAPSRRSRMRSGMSRSRRRSGAGCAGTRWNRRASYISIVHSIHTATAAQGEVLDRSASSLFRLGYGRFLRGASFGGCESVGEVVSFASRARDEIVHAHLSCRSQARRGEDRAFNALDGRHAGNLRVCEGAIVSTTLL